MNAELAAYHILANNATFNAHVGGSAAASRIYYDIAPQTAALPYTIVRESSVDPNDTKSGSSNFDFGNIEVRHFAAGRNKVAEMARDARLALDRVSEGTYNSIQVVSASFETQFSDVEEMEDSVQHIKEQNYKFITRR